MIETSYLSRVIALPPLVAQAAFDAALPPTRGLRTTADPRRTDGRRGMPYRTASGLLSAGWRTHRVEVDLTPWSRTEVELGLMPLTRRVGRALPASLADAGYCLLDRLAAAMRSWADAPLASALHDVGPLGVSTSTHTRYRPVDIRNVGDPGA